MKTMWNLITLLTLLVVSSGLASAGELINADAAAKVGLQGYDAVAFFTENEAVKGNPAVAASYEGHTYYFATEENKAAFEVAPERYLPAYGGYCAYGVSVGALFPVEIDTWEIVNGRLLLQYNDAIRTLFNQDTAANLQKAEANWPQLVAEHAK